MNGKFSARWEVNDMIVLRGAASTGFRAPTSGQQNTQNLTTGFPFNSVVPLGNLTARPDSAIGQFYLAQPLKPEKSTSFSGCLVLTPGSGFNLTLDYYNITVKDRIGITGNINPAADVAFLLAQGIPEAAELDAVRYFTNAFKTRTQGVDMVLSHRANTGIGRFSSSLAINYNNTKVLERRTITGALARGRTITLSPVDDVRVGNIELSQPRWRAVLSSSWTDGTFDAIARVNYFGSYTTFFDPVTSGIGATPGVTAAEAAALYLQSNWSKKFGAQASGDLEVGMTFAEKYRLAGGALNGSIYPDTAPTGQQVGFWYVRASARF